MTLGFGQTHAYLWGDDAELLADDVEEILDAVFAGRFVEAGRRGDGFARLRTRGGEVRIGSIHLPMPWRLRTTRTYAPYRATR